MTLFTGIIDAAALHLDRNDVFRRTVMGAARLVIEVDSDDGRGTI